MSGINFINNGDPEESPELYENECDRINYAQTHLTKKNGEKIACNQVKEESRSDLYQMYCHYLDTIGKSNQKEWSSATKFWRTIKDWCSDKEKKWGQSVRLFDDEETGVKKVEIKPIEMRDLLKEHIHLLWC